MPDRSAETPRNRILVAANRLFRQRGVAATNVEDIAAEAGMSRATLYRHVTGGRDEIVLSVIAWNAEQQIRRLVDTVAAETEVFEERVVRLFRGLDQAMRADEAASAMFRLPSMGAMVAVEGWTEAAFDLTLRSLAPVLARSQGPRRALGRAVRPAGGRVGRTAVLVAGAVALGDDRRSRGIRHLRPNPGRRAPPGPFGGGVVNPGSPDDVEAVVRREIARQGRRWAPIGVALLLLLTVLATSQDSSDRTTTEAAGSPFTTDLTGAPVAGGLGTGRPARVDRRSRRRHS